MLNDADASLVKATAQAYRESLLRAGPLTRLNRKQRAALTEAHSQFFALVDKLLGEHRLHHKDEDGGRSWDLLTSVLAKKDPLWYTRGGTGVAAAIASISRLTSPIE